MKGNLCEACHENYTRDNAETCCELCFSALVCSVLAGWPLPDDLPLGHTEEEPE